ncbi:hypothetical protein Q3G72_004985 [Acer saccharum]|nr:hypothetical protein Q3G72_004985 [Acer saccharum]
MQNCRDLGARFPARLSTTRVVREVSFTQLGLCDSSPLRAPLMFYADQANKMIKVDHAQISSLADQDHQCGEGGSTTSGDLAP